MSTCDSTGIEACLVPDTVADTTMSCEKPVMAEASAAAKVSIEQSSSTEEQQGTLIALEEVPEHDCDAVDGDVIPQQDSSVPLEGLVADEVLVEDHSINVVEQECSPEPDSAVELPKNEAGIMTVEGCFEDEAQGENQSPPVNETPTEIPTPEQQRKAARLAKREDKDEETTGVDGSQSTAADDDVGALAINEEAPAEATTAAEETTKPRKLNSKQRKAKARRLAAEKVGASASAETTVEVKSSSPVTVAVVETEGVAQKKKKLTSTERRARKLAQESEKAAETEAIPVEDVTPTETPGDSMKTESADNVVVKAKKLGSKQRKAKQRAAEAAQAAATLAGLAKAEPAATTSAVNPDSAAVVAVAPEGGSNEAPARKKLTSTERRAKRDAKLAALEATPPTDPPTSPPVTAAAVPVATASTISASAQEESEGVPKARKLNSKQRKALRLARERAEAEAEKSTTEVTSFSLVKPAAPTQELVEKAPKANPAPKKASVVNTHAGTTVSAVTTKQMTSDQSIALHATLAVLRQGLLSRDSVIYTQQGAMKMHLLTELCKLGYPCIEGNANSFQQITWCGTNQCLTYTTAMVNAPQQYPATLRAKGELKIAVPGLSVQLKCYPTFGAGSPALMGNKNFRNGFVRHFDEVAARETDVFVFVLPVGVYHQYAREAVMTLPAAQNIQKHLSGHGVKYVTKNQDEVNLRGAFCAVETLCGEFIVGSVTFA